MILQALYDYYQRKSASADSALAPAGFEYKEIPFILEIRADGKLVQIEDTRAGDGKKKRAKSERVPQGVKKTSGIAANLLWDNAEYVLGIDSKGKSELVQVKQAAFAERIRQLNITEQDEGIAAVLAFLESLDTETLQQQQQWKEIVATNPNLTFRLQGQRHLVSQSRRVQAAIMNTAGDCNTKAICLLTGEQAEIERLHPSIKGVWGAQSSGANIISFNLDAFTSYGKTQSFNAPVSKEAAFAYTTALNHLLRKDSVQRIQVGDASTVFWASKDDALEDGFSALWGATDSKKDDPDRNANAVRALYRAVEEHGRNPVLSEETIFYILGLAPNAARISIRFWHVGTVLEVSQRIVKHFKLLEIDHKETEHEFLPLWRLLKSIAPLDDVKRISPNLAGDMMHSILEDLHYPSTLLAAVVQRIRAEQSKKDKNTGKLLPNVTYPRAALIKAYLNRLDEMENITVSLNLENMNLGYRLGRLFALLEKIQKEAMPGINTTIRERYYGAASSTPVTVFPTLIKLKNHHLKKISNKGRVINFEKMLSDVMDGIDDENPFPATFKLEDQGRFAVGYYHQYQCMAKGNDVNNCIKGD